MEYLTEKEASEYLGISGRTIRRKKQAGLLGSIKVPRAEGGYEIHYPKDELDKLRDGAEAIVHPAFDHPDTPGQSEMTYHPDTPGQSVAEQSDTMDLVYAIARHLAEAMALQRKPLDAYRELEEAVERGWILPSSKVKELIGVHPRGECFLRGSFEFVRWGKIGSEIGWLVNRCKQ